MKVLILSGSSREKSNSFKVSSALLSLLKGSNIQSSILDLKESDVQLIGEQLKNIDNYTQFQQKCIDKFTEADTIFIVAPEYNWGMSGLMKNFLDQFGTGKFLSMWDKKTFALTGVSDGTGGKFSAAEIMISLNKIISFAGAVSIVSPKIFLSQKTETMVDKDGNFIDQGYKDAMTRFIDYSLNISLIFQKGLSY